MKGEDCVRFLYQQSARTQQRPAREISHQEDCSGFVKTLMAGIAQEQRPMKKNMTYPSDEQKED